MNRYKLSMAGIDVKEGIHRFSDRKDIYESLLMEFPEDTCYRELLAAIEQKDVKAAFMAAHSLKGITGNYSMKELYENLLPLVEELRSGSMENAEELLVPIEKSYQKVIAALTEQEK